ncbi:hypothetical protein [Roseibium sp.]|uniref:hypothetical protein n=1 Tax=Roseibium sp. TaxID=1936156 RepID=UPI003267EE1E
MVPVVLDAGHPQHPLQQYGLLELVGCHGADRFGQRDVIFGNRAQFLADVVHLNNTDRGNGECCSTDEPNQGKNFGGNGAKLKNAHLFKAFSHENLKSKVSRKVEIELFTTDEINIDKYINHICIFVKVLRRFKVSYGYFCIILWIL